LKPVIGKESGMTEIPVSEIWRAYQERVVAMIDAYSAPWMPTGPSAATAKAIMNMIRAMPAPRPGRQS
jgi:hypothetical protein